MRRIAVTTLLAAVALILGTLPAAAAVSTAFGSPTSGDVTGPTGIQVRVQREVLDPQVTAVHVRLDRGGTWAPLSCAGCGDEVQGGTETDAAWGGLQLQPNSPDEFGIPGRLANGPLTLTSRWQDGDGTWTAGAAVEVTLSVPPSPVSDLAAGADQRDVTVRWTRAPEPDISAYRIQRRPTGGAWTVVGSVDGSTSSYRETAPTDGSYDYRVITVRPDGHGGSITATSAAVTVLAAAQPEPTSPGSPSDSGSGDGSGGTSDGSSPGPSEDGSSTPSDEGSGRGGGTDAGGTTPSDEGSSTSARGSGRSRVAAPPGVRQGSSPDVDADLPAPEVAPEAERYYGEGEGFSEELGYGAVDPVLPEQGVDGDPVLRRIPGGIQDFILSRFEVRTFLTSIAAGLVFVTLGLHGLRWMRATAED